MSVCHAEKAVTARYGHRDCRLCAFIPSHTLLLRPVRGLLLGAVTAAGSSPGPAPRLRSAGSLPSGFAALPPARMRVQPWRSLHHLGRSEARGGGGRGGRQRLPRAARPLPPPTVEAHLLCLAACAHVGQGDRLTLILSLAQSWRVDFWKFPPENLHFWGLSVLSPAYQ